MIKSGLKLKSEDVRDYKLSAAYDLPPLSELPEKFEIEPVFIGNQKNSYMCTAFSTCGNSALQEGTPLVPEFTFAAIGQVAGRISLEGYELRDAMKSHIKIGAIEEKDRPEGFNLSDKSDEFLADIKNWPDLYDKALIHAKKTYVSVGEDFDQIRQTIWLFREQKRGVNFGVFWNWPIYGSPYIKEVPLTGSGHALYSCGWDGDYLIVVNSYGKEAGDKGKFYIHKKVINYFANKFGVFSFVDLTQAEYLILAESRKKQFNILFQIVGVMKDLVSAISSQIQNLFKKKIEMDTTTLDELTPVIPEEPKYKWSTPQEACHSVRVLCDEAGLSVENKNLICQTINCESGFKTNAVHKNQDKRNTSDFGICQFNSYWYRDLISPNEALNNPEKAVRLMISQFKKGQLKDWVCFSTNKYKNYSSKVV